MLPSLFVSHGSPMLALSDTPARDFLCGLAATLPRPKAIVIVSAHWDTERPEVNAVTINPTIHDFYGFPPALHAMRYPAPGAPDLARRVANLLATAGLPALLNTERGLDHGAWVPLTLMYPDHDIPVLQVSLQSWLGPVHHLALGAALTPLLAEDVLVIGSGAFTHNLSRLRRGELNGPAEPDVVAFTEWMDQAITGHRIQELIDYRRQAPYGALQHPTEEHLLPLFVAIGAAGDHAAARRLHASTTYGSLRMDAYEFIPA